MKVLLIFLLVLSAGATSAQRYALIDKSFASPITYTENLNVAQKVKGMFPVEKSHLPEFVKALEEISAKLHANGKLGKAVNYQMGCTTFTGFTVNLARGDRLDYILKSNCDNFSTTMHLSDSKLTNESNAYFIDTWLKYIKSNLKSGG